jgi:hypothetical protein
VTGGESIAILLQSVSDISDVSAVNPLIDFYDIHGRKGEVVFYCSVPDTTQIRKKIVYLSISILTPNLA